MSSFQKSSLTGFVVALCLAGSALVVSTAYAAHDITTDVPPPASIHEKVPAPRSGSAWDPGHWEWYGRFYHWVPGTWVVEHHGYHWIAAQWEQTDSHWHYLPGHLEHADVQGAVVSTGATSNDR